MLQRRLAIGIGAAWALCSGFILFVYAERYPHLVTWPRHLFISASDCFGGEHEHLFENVAAMAHAIATFAILIGTVASLGAWIQRALPERREGCDARLEALGLGAIALHYLMLASGLAGLWYREWILGGAVLALLSGGILWFTSGRPLPRIGALKQSFSDHPWLAILLALIALTAVEGLAPGTAADNGLYHLGLPSTWLADHRISFLRDRYLANVPVPQSMFYAFLMAIGPIDSSGLFQPALLLFSAIVLARTVSRYVDRHRFPFEGFALLATPALHGYLAASGNDQLTIAFFALGLHFGLRAIDAPLPDARGFAIALLFLGFGMSVKYTALAHGLIVALFLAITWLRRRGSVGALIPSALLFILPFSIWAAKAWLDTGNPVFPALSSIFGSEHADPAGIANAHASNVPRIRGLWEHLTFVAQATLKPALMYNPGPHWLLLMPVLAVAGWFVARDKRTYLIAVLAIAAGWAAWALLYMNARYSAPLFAMTGVAMSIALNRGLSHVDRYRRAAIGSIGVLMLWFTAMSWAYRSEIVRPYTYLCGGFDRLGYVLDQDLPMTVFPEHGMIDHLNRTLDPDRDRVLVIGEDRTGGLEIPHIAGTRYDRPIFEHYVATASTAAEVRERLARDRITHVAINLGGGAFFERFGYPILTIAPAKEALWSDFTTRWLDVLEHHRKGEHDWAVARIRDEPSDERAPDFIDQMLRAAGRR